MRIVPFLLASFGAAAIWAADPAAPIVVSAASPTVGIPRDSLALVFGAGSHGDDVGIDAPVYLSLYGTGSAARARSIMCR